MNCPKCGFAQEERSDCRKCGVVISKYLALHSPVKSPHPDGIEVPGEHPSEEATFPDALEMRRMARDLVRISTEVEFERAERTRLKAEIKQLTERLEREISAAADRLLNLENTNAKAEAELAATMKQNIQVKEFETSSIEPLKQRIEAIDSRFDSVEIRLAEADKKIEEVMERGSEEPLPPLEDDVHAIRQNLDELRRLLTVAAGSHNPF